MLSQEPAAAAELDIVLRVAEDPRWGAMWEVVTPGTRARFHCGLQAQEYLNELLLALKGC